MTNQEIRLKNASDIFRLEFRQGQYEDEYKTWFDGQVSKLDNIPSKHTRLQDKLFKISIVECSLAGSAIGALLGVPYAITTGGLSVFIGIVIGAVVGGTATKYIDNL